MQIRLTVVDPQGPPPTSRARAASCDVLVTAPAGTALAAVASALAAAAAAGGGASSTERGREPGSGPVVLYAGTERLDAQRCTLGEPPLLDGAVLTLGAPAEPGPEPDEDAAQLHVVAGPDAGGVHLLHGGVIRIGRSADADVPLDDPDVSRLHCAVTVTADGRVSVADLGSTNGTVLDGHPVTDQPVRLAPGALLRLGESSLRLAASRGIRSVGTAPDGEGHVRVLGEEPGGTTTAEPRARTGRVSGFAPGAARGGRTGGDGTPRDGRHGSGTAAPEGRPAPEPGPARTDRPAPAGSLSADTRHGFGDTAWGASGGHAPGAQEHRPGEPPSPGPSGPPRRPEEGPAAPAVPEQGGAPSVENPVPVSGGAMVFDGTRKGTPPRGIQVPPGLRRRGAFTAWARRLAGSRLDQGGAGRKAYEEGGVPAFAALQARAPEKWPDPAALLLTALGPGPRLWERGPDHPEALTVRLGTADRVSPDGSGVLPAVPVTAGLREVGALGLAGPRERLTGLARAVVAQLAALHSPDALELVLISADRSRPLAERTADWSWLGWLPQVRPGHGQDCRLLLAYDADQAVARTDELLRRLKDHLAEPAGFPATSGAARPTVTDHTTGPDRGTGTTGPSGPTGRAYGTWHPPAAQDAPARRGAGRRRPSPVQDGAFTGPRTVVVVDGDPGAEVREALVRLARDGARAGIHLLCLAEAPSCSPASPVTQTYEAACAVSPAFRECGAVGLLSGDVATALRLLRVAPGEGTDSARGTRAPVGHGTVAAVDAVSPAWAERFARALAPLRPDGGGDRHPRVSAPLPQMARLLDELGLARATPASLMARWADATDDPGAPGGRAWAVLGAGPRGPVPLDLAAEGPHLLIEGPPGSGRTELLRSIAAALASVERPDRLGLVLVDGRDRDRAENGARGGDDLGVCTDLPHVTTHLTANDPVRMREFAQSLSAELKRRAELLGRLGFIEWHLQREVSSSRIVPQRAGGSASGDLDSPPSTTLRLRPGAKRRQPEPGPALARLVVLVDDLDALLSPALGSPGRPAAGSVVRALEAVALHGGRLGVHLVAATHPGGRTAQWEPARTAPLRIALEEVSSGADEPAPGRGRLTRPDGTMTPFQGGRITGRIPRTATLRPTVVPLEWHRMGDPPTRRPVRELGNGPTDLALLASALERAARSVSATEVPSLL